jgi:signal transduction histidine kinase/ActR/RegA family two-component response regulator
VRTKRFFWRWSFLAAALAYCLTVIGLFWYSASASNQLVRSHTIEELSHHADLISKFRNFYSAEIVARAREHGIRISHDYKETPHTLPLPATFMIDFGKYLGQYESNTSLEVYSKYPFPWRVAERQLDSFQNQALAHFEAGNSEPFVREELRNGQWVMRFAKADRLSESCVACHNSHPQSPKSGWVTGDIRGVLELTAPLAELNQSVDGLIKGIFNLMFATSAIGLTLVWLAFRRLNRLNLRAKDQTRQLQESNQQLLSSQTQLVVARDKAESANRLKDRFLANMSHEIRTPMNGIMGMTELVLQSPLTAEQSEHLKLAHSSAEHLVNIINDVLDFSKIDTGHLTLQPSVMNPMRVIEETIQNLRPQLQAKSVLIKTQPSAAVPTHVMADPVRFRQIMTNLIGNAIKFTHEGQITIDCDWLSRDTLHIVVTDTGIGFDPAQAEALFDAFVQADGSITRSYGGTGLGLAITRSLITLMGGTISATSTLGRGSAFTFKIHAQTAEDQAATLAALDEATQGQAPQVPPPAAANLARSLHILIAEDHPINQKILSLLLTKMGHTTTVASDGAQALAALQGGTFDLVLMDVMMPGVDGLTALQQWREIERGTGSGTGSGTYTPIIMVTAMAMSGDQERFIAAGADGYVSKPVSSASLIAEMSRVLSSA